MIFKELLERIIKKKKKIKNTNFNLVGIRKHLEI